MKYIFWGYFLIFFHLRINGIDLLPDFVGYILIVMGLGQLAEESEHFVKAKPWAVFMAVLHIVTGLLGFVGLLGYPFGSLLGLVFSCFSLYIMNLIGHGIRETEQKKAIDMGGEKFRTLWKCQAIFTIGCQVMALLTLVLLANILLLPSLIANIVYLVYLHRARKALEECEDETEGETQSNF